MARTKYYNKEKSRWEYADKGGSGNGGASLIIDTEMSDTSENAVQNKAIKQYIDKIDNKSLGVSNAQIGQIIEVESVDETGKPTKWKAVDKPAGGQGGQWRFLGTITTHEDVSSLTMTKDKDGQPLNLKAVLFEGRLSTSASVGSIYATTSNGDTRNAFCSNPTGLSYGLSYRFIYVILDGYGKWILEQAGTDENIAPLEKINLRADVPKLKTPVDYRYSIVSNITSVGIKTKDGVTAIGNGTNLSVWGLE